MNVTEKVAGLLLETGDDPKVKAYFDRLLLRIFSVPPLLNSFADVAMVDGDSAPDAKKIQLDFYTLPTEVIPQLLRFFAAPRPAKMYRYIKNGSARMGFEIEVKPDDFPGEEIDYAQ